MELPVSASVACVVALTAMSAFGAALFEDVHAVKWKKGTHGYRGANGDFVALKDGSVLMAYTHNNSIVAKKSADKGKTWSRQSTLVPAPKAPARGRYCHPSFLRLKNGDILLAYIYSSGSKPYFGHNYVRRSADEGKTWTEQFVMTPHPGYVIMHNDRLFTLASGRIVGIAEYKAHMPSSHDHSGYVGIAFFSDDNGHSWQVSRNTVDLYAEKRIEVQEADGVELRDGRVLMFARSYSGHPVFAWSKDGCETWSKGRMIKKLRMPYAGMPTVRRIPSTGDLLFIWIDERSQDKDNPRIRRRCGLASAISKDEGKTFVHHRHIAHDPDDDFGYQGVEFLGNKLALVSYHARDGLHVARIGIDWFYGK